MIEYRIWDMWGNCFIGESISDKEEARKRAHFLSEGKGEAGGIQIKSRKVTEWEPV